MKPIPKLRSKIEKAYGRFSIVRNGFWFVDIPRTSSSSIRTELGTQFGRAYAKKNVVEKKYSRSQIFDDHIPAKQMKDILGKPVWDRIFTFTIVRNPWDRVLSMYHYRKKKNNIPGEWTFYDYVCALGEAHIDSSYFEFEGFRLGSADYILGENGEIIVDFIAKYENRSHDLKVIASRLGLNKLGELHIQNAKPEELHYSTFYNSETQEIIRRLYSKDISLFGYEFDDQI